MHTYGMIIVDDEYLLSNHFHGKNLHRRSKTNKHLCANRRATHYVLPSVVLTPPPHRTNDNVAPIPTERQSFGRKHHWDTYFGRRR